MVVPQDVLNALVREPQRPVEHPFSILADPRLLDGLGDGVGECFDGCRRARQRGVLGDHRGVQQGDASPCQGLGRVPDVDAPHYVEDDTSNHVQPDLLDDVHASPAFE